MAHAVDVAYGKAATRPKSSRRAATRSPTPEQIAKLGVPGIDVVAVSTSLVKSNPQLVQKYVCAEVQATKLFAAPQGGKYLAQSAGVQGVSANEIIPATKAYPFIPLSQQLYWLGSTANDTSSPIVKAYVQTAQFLVQQGRLQSVPSAAAVAAHTDPTFAKNALSGPGVTVPVDHDLPVAFFVVAEHGRREVVAAAVALAALGVDLHSH